MAADEDSLPVPPRLPPQRPGPPEGKRAANRRRRVQALCEAALRLFLDEGIAAVPIERIAAGAGTSKGNFYRYFRDKEELVATLLAPLEGGLEAALDETERRISRALDDAGLIGSYQQLGGTLGELLFAHTDVVRLYLQEARGPAVGARRPVSELAERIAARAVDLTVAARRRGLLRPFPPRVSALVVVGAVERLLHEHLAGRPAGDPVEVVLSLIGIVMDGMTPRPEDEPAP